MTPLPRSPNVGVIGAGPSGLVACKTLAAHGLRYTAYEAGDRVGGQWVLGNSSGTSAAYRSLHTNTHKGMSRFSDFPLPDDYPDFPSHAQMAAWFADYAEHFGLNDHIRFGVRVLEVTPEHDGGYTLSLDGSESVHHDALIVASGNLWNPHWPSLPGEFAGELVHAKDYMDPTDPVDCRGRNVLVIGLGNTACDFAVELSGEGQAARTFLSARSGQHIIPKLVAPVPHPSEPLEGTLAWLPPSIRDAVFRRAFPKALGGLLALLPDPVEMGLPAPPASFFEKRPVINDHIYDRLGAGSIRPKPGIRAIRGGVVEFADGSEEEIDVIVAATGYDFTLPYLSDAVLGGAPDEIPLFCGVMHPERHDLFIIGVMKPICSVWPRSEQQMKFVAPLLTGEYALPAQATIDRESYPVMGVPFGNCQFYTHDLGRELERGRARASKAR